MLVLGNADENQGKIFYEFLRNFFEINFRYTIDDFNSDKWVKIFDKNMLHRYFQNLKRFSYNCVWVQYTFYPIQAWTDLD